MTCLIVDDEKQSRNALIEEIHSLQMGIEIIGEADNTQLAIQSVDTLQPDIVFLDIELGDGNGFDVIEKIRFKESDIIFVTAYNQYAVRAFRISALDYLLKPVNRNQLKEAIQRADKQVSAKIEILKEQLNPSVQSPKRIAFATNDGLSIHLIQDIVRCESDSNYTHVHFINQEPVVISKTLKDIEDLLLQEGFERVHQSHLINLKYLRKYIHKEGGYVLLNDEVKIPVSQRKKTVLLEKINQFLSIG